MRLYYVLTASIIAIFFLSMFFSVYSGEIYRSMPNLLGIDASANSMVLISKSELDQTFGQIRQLMLISNERGNNFSLAQNIVDWLAIVLSAIIALLAGLSGKILSPEQGAGTVDVSNMPKKYLKVIAFVAALNAMCVVISAPLQRSSQSDYKKADAIFALSSSTRKAILESEDPIVQRDLLDKLLMQSSR